MSVRFLITCLASALLLPAAAGGFLDTIPMHAEAMHQWKLPRDLTEISGLSMTADGRLLAIDDERAIIYELDYQDGHIVKSFSLGKPTIRGDFEGIAVANALVFLVDSKGRLYVTSEGEDGERMNYDRVQTRLGQLCEIEGLASTRDDSRLLILCKNVLDDEVIDDLMVFVWSIEERRLLAEESILIPTEAITATLETKKLRPSGIAVDPATGNLVVVAAREQAVFELTMDGELLGARVLPEADRHRQAEGIEISGDGKLLIADEGGSKKARLAIYRPEGGPVEDD